MCLEYRTVATDPENRVGPPREGSVSLLSRLNLNLKAVGRPHLRMGRRV